ncbi:MAG TPA: class I SAM-dependent methyltransferase [Gaiellaceae bacterium]
MAVKEHATYGDELADVYDDHYQFQFGETAAAVSFLAQLAGAGRALELGIGTGRLAIPLAEQGVDVRGIEMSEQMVRKLRAKPGGAEIPVTVGDIADVPVDGRFSLVFAAFHTLLFLTTQEEQVRCFRNVAERLEAGGAFVVEAWIPHHASMNDYVRVTSIGLHEVQLQAMLYDPVTQLGMTHDIVVDEGGVKTYPYLVRSIWPAELDLMAQLAGLRLVERWASWLRQPLEQDSRYQISVYRSPEPGRNGRPGGFGEISGAAQRPSA